MSETSCSSIKKYRHASCDCCGLAAPPMGLTPCTLLYHETSSRFAQMPRPYFGKTKTCRTRYCWAYKASGRSSFHLIRGRRQTDPSSQRDTQLLRKRFVENACNGRRLFASSCEVHSKSPNLACCAQPRPARIGLCRTLTTLILYACRARSRMSRAFLWANCCCNHKRAVVGHARTQ